MCQTNIRVWNFLFNGISGRKDFYERKASQELCNCGSIVGMRKATKVARFIGRANLTSFHCFLMLMPKWACQCESLSSPPHAQFLVGLMERDFFSLQALSLCSLTLTGSCTNVLNKTVPWWTVMHKGFALSNEITPTSPTWCIPTANVLNQKKKKKVINFLTDWFWGVKMLIHQKLISLGNKSLSWKSSSERNYSGGFFSGELFNQGQTWQLKN